MSHKEASAGRHEAQPACKAAVYKLHGGPEEWRRAPRHPICFLGERSTQATGKKWTAGRGRRGGKTNRTQHCHCFQVPRVPPNRDIRKHGAGLRQPGEEVRLCTNVGPPRGKLILPAKVLPHRGSRLPRRQDGASASHHWWANTSGERRHEQGRQGPLGWRRVSRN